MGEPTVQDMIQAFARRQMGEVIERGASLALSPVTVAATLMQLSASVLAHVAPVPTVAMLRAYADVIEAGPDNPLDLAVARERFEGAAEAFRAEAEAAASFPAPQGRA